MRAYVYTDASLERYAGRFVWLSINTEDAKNAAFLKRYPIPALPTVLVLDPHRDRVALRHVGGATVPQLRKLLDDAESTFLEQRTSRADKLLAQADRLASEGDQSEAVKWYADAVAAAPRAWKRLGRAAESLVLGLSMAGNHARCAARARELYPRLRGTPSAAVVASTGLSCAVTLDSNHAARRALLKALEAAALEAFADPSADISDDDRSSMYIALIDARDAAGDDEEVIRLEHEWAAFLERAAGRAATPEQRAVYDAHRLSAYLALRTPEKAVAMLEQSERDFPDDYNPPARLAVAWKAMQAYDEALAASDRALAKVYGPRRVAVLSVRADIYAARGDTKAERETLLEALEFAKSLPVGQRSEERIAALEKRLASMP